MSINSISAASSYYSSITSVGNNDEYELVKRRLLALGIVPIGNENVDKLVLQKSEKPQKSDEDNANPVKRAKPSQQQMDGASSNILIAWQNLMQELGLTASGDIDADYRRAIAVIKSKIANTTDEAEKNKYRSLQTKIDKLVADNLSSSASAATAMVGASALADMNKAYLVKQQ